MEAVLLVSVDDVFTYLLARQACPVVSCVEVGFQSLLDDLLMKGTAPSLRLI
jgi:hypothetical protein